MMKIAIIANPCSGAKRTGRLLPKVRADLKALDIRADIFLSKDGAHLRRLAQTLDITPYSAIVAMGGDGTNFHLINGLLSGRRPEQLPPLGIIPAGSGNSFVRDLDILNPEQAVTAIARQRARPVDLMAYRAKGAQFYFVNLMGVGFVTDVAVTAQRFKRLNDLSYLVGVVHRTLSLSCDPMDVIVDGKKFSGPFCFVEFCNSRFTGGGMLMAPEARIDDGLMDIILVRSLSRCRLLLSLPKIFKGEHLNMPEVICVRGKNAEIRTPAGRKRLLPDGEVLGTTPGTVQVMPRQLRYLW